MHQAALPQRGTHGLLERADQPGRAVADHQQRAAQPAFAEPGEQPFPRVAGLTGRRVEPDEHRLAVGVDAPPGQHRLGRRVRVILEMRSVQEQNR